MNLKSTLTLLVASICLWTLGTAQEADIKISEDAKIEQKDFLAELSGQIFEGVCSGDIGVDSAWEVFFALNKEATKRDSLLIFINLLAETQKLRTSKTNESRIRGNGPFIRAISEVLSVSGKVLLRGYCSTDAAKKLPEEEFIFDARRLFLGLHNGEVDKLMER